MAKSRSSDLKKGSVISEEGRKTFEEMEKKTQSNKEAKGPGRPKNKTERTAFTTNLDKTFIKRLKRYAFNNDVSVNLVIEEVLSDFLKSKGIE